MWSLAIDVIFAALLVATIVFAFRLERRLAALRGTKDQLAGVIAELNAAAARAEAGIRGLKAAAETAGTSLDERVKRAQSLSYELHALMASSQRMAPPQRSAAAPEKREAPRPARFGTRG